MTLKSNTVYTTIETTEIVKGSVSIIVEHEFNGKIIKSDFNLSVGDTITVEQPIACSENITLKLGANEMSPKRKQLTEFIKKHSDQPWTTAARSEGGDLEYKIDTDDIAAIVDFMFSTAVRVHEMEKRNEMV